MNNKKLIIITLLIAAAALTACTGTTVDAGSTASAQAQNQPDPLIAEGKLMPVRSLDLSFAIPGTIKEILVTDGQKVNEGEVLARLTNNSDAMLALAQARQQALSAQQNLDNVKNSSLTGTEAALELAQAQSDYNNALGNYWQSSQTQGTEDMITATRAKLIILDNKIKDLKDHYDSMVETPDNDTKKAQVLQDLSQARIDRVNLKKLLDYYEANPSTLDVQNLKAELDVAKSKLEDAQRKYNRSINGIDPEELALAEAQLKTANAAVESAQSALDATEIRATISGTVIDINAIPGQQVTANQTLMSLADYSSWIVETDNLTETDVVKITPGQKAEVVLDALPDVPLSGVVSHINSRYLEQRGDITYTVTITLTQTDPRMRWGMTAAVKFSE